VTSISQEVPDSPEAFGPPVHPHQLEIQEFSSYGLIIDARSVAAFDEDHLPGALCAPSSWSNAGVALPTGAGSALLATEANPALPYGLAAVLDQLPADGSVLVYDDRGGLDSQFWAERLQARGWHVDVLPGGWPNYRRWVTAGLELLPRTLTLTHWSAPPLGGTAQVLAALATQAEQVLDLGALAHPERLIWGHWRQTSRSQEAFETLLLDQLRRLDPERRIHVGGVSELGGLTLPAGLRDALAGAEGMVIAATPDARVRAWREVLEALGWLLPDFLEHLQLTREVSSFGALQGALTLSRAGSVDQALAAALPPGLAQSGPVVRPVAGEADPGRLPLAALTPDEVAAALVSQQSRSPTRSV
jgi:tRNA 2-selenouridine synthase